MGASQNYNVNLNINANAQSAQQQLQKLQQQLQQISAMKIDVGANVTKQQLEEASQAALKLSSYLQQATNMQTGNLDFTKLNNSINKSNMSLEQYCNSLRRLGPQGEQAFMNLAQAVAKSEIPLRRTSELTQKMWDGFKRTAGWQLQSSMIHGIIGGVKSAVGYAKDLNKSLTDIRIVTGSSADEMARFAQRANDAAKKLSTTTTDYTRASLIYYQQGLNDAEVKARTEATIKMANATGTSAQQVSDQMTAIWNNYANGSKQLTHYADVMTALGAATASSTDEIAQGLQKFASISNTVGLSYEYAASALATITAESRESADVVGNALKTLFSRIQGLQLGETLDDGTTLNKYSTALAKVGISIKNQSGGLKDMDDILDEMGSKWDTLARDEKMALAQTVAGVRQYTQLMTLMENWDDFKTNLNVANTSTGTLDKQASIYAESWEAASERVRASWEGLWDNLISSDGFITLLDGLSDVIEFLDKMVSGLGGAGGAMLTFGGILTSVFGKQISTSLANTAYGIKMMMPGQYAKTVSERETLIESIKDSIGKDTVLSVGREEEFKTRRNNLDDALRSSLLYSRNRDSMSAEQLSMEQHYSQQMSNLQNEKVKTSIQVDKSLAARDNFFSSFYDKNYANNDLEKIFNYEEVIANRKAVAQAGLKQRETQLNDIKSQLYTKESLRTGKLVERNNLNANIKMQLRDQITKLQNEIQTGKNWMQTGIDKEMQDLNNSIFNRQANVDANNVIEQQIKHNQNRINYLNKKYKGQNINWDEEAEEGTALAKDQQKYRQSKQSLAILKGVNLKQPLTNETNFSGALQAQGKAVASLNQVFSQIPKNSADAEQLLVGLSEFSTTASNSMGSHQFIKDMTNLASQAAKGEIDINSKEFQQQYQKLTKTMLPTFAKEAMDSVSGSIYDTLMHNPKFAEGQKMSREEFIEQARSYQDTEAGKIRLQEIDKLYQKTVADREKNLQKKETIRSGAQAVVSGAQGAMQALAAGESLKSLISSFKEGSATFTSTLTGLTSTLMQSAMGFSGLNNALSSIPGLSAGAAGGIALAITAVLALSSAVAEAIDNANVSSKEYTQNLLKSTNDLQSTAKTTQEATEIVKNENEEYFNNLKKVESLDNDPTTIAQDIFESNQKALELIKKHNLQINEDYYQDTNGLIKIKETSLENKLDETEQIAKNAEYASIVGIAINNKKLNEVERETSITSQAGDNYNWSHSRNHSVIGDWITPYVGLDKEEKAFFKEYDTDEKKGYLSTEELQKIYNDGNWGRFIELFSLSGVELSNMEEAIKIFTDNENAVLQDDINVRNATRVITNKMLNEQGITPTSIKGYSAYSDYIAEQIEKEYYNDWLTEDIVKKINRTYNEDTRKEISRLLEENGLAENATITGSKDGQISYKAEGSEEVQYISAETLNYWKASENILKNADNLIKQGNEEYKKFEGYGIGAEAAFNIQRFGTISGSSANSVFELLNNKDFLSFYKNEEIGKNEFTKASGIKEWFEESFNGISGYKDILNDVTLGSLDTLKNSIDSLGVEDQQIFNNLISSISKSTSEDINAEDYAQILTVLSNFDFSDSAYQNVNKLKSALEQLGYPIDTSGLEKLYNILSLLAGLGPKSGLENLAKNSEVATKDLSALNKITPKGTVDEATMTAAQDAGLTGKFSKNSDGTYTYTGTQEDIDNAKSNANAEFGRVQSAIDEAQKNKPDGLPEGSFNSSKELKQALVGKRTFWDFLTGKEANGNTELAEALGLEVKDGTIYDKQSGNEISDSDLSAYLNKYNNMTMSEETQQSQASDHFANISSAKDMMTAVNEAKERGDKAGFIDKNGIISDEAITRLQALPETSSRATAALDALSSAKAKYNENTGDGEEIVKEAQAYYDLQQEIDTTAEARGLDAEAVASQAEAVRELLKTEGVDAKGIAQAAADAVMAQEALDDLNSSAKTFQKISAKIANQEELVDSKDLQNLNKMQQLFTKIAGAEDAAIKDTNKLNTAFQKFLTDNPDAMQDFLKGTGPAIQKWQAEIAKLAASEDLKSIGKTMSDATEQAFQQLGETMGKYSDKMNIGDTLEEAFGKGSAAVTEMQSSMQSAIDGMAKDGMNFDQIMSDLENSTDFELVPVEKEADADVSIPYSEIQQTGTVDEATGAIDVVTDSQNSDTVDSKGKQKMKFFKLVKKGGSGGKSSGGGGGGGGGKEPKKVAQTRRSQVVKRYKNIDAKRSTNKNRRDNMSKKTDKLYGESRITNLQKENKLLEEGLKLNEKKAEEALKNLKIDEESLRKMTKKYGYELELDSEGNIKNYEQILGDIYDQIHKLELDGELSEEEEKIKEELEIKKQEIEGAMEDWEDTLKQLEELNNEYEELIDEMHSNELEQITYKLEFELELNELDAEWYDFLNEQIGDDFTQAVDTMDLITEKIKIANDNINLYKQSVTDLMENIENDPNRSLITGYLEDGVLTDEEAEILKEAYSGIIEQLSALTEAKTSAEELLVSIFEGYKERIDLDTTALEHYTSLLEHFGNVVDIVGQKQLGLSDQFMENMAKMRIQQSRDIMSAAQSELAAYEQIRAEAEEELARAREEGRTNDIDYWQQQLNEANTSIQEARDKLVTSFEDNLNAIADAFDKAVERIVQTFNDAVYAFGGLEGLSEDYSFIRENTELMAQDYEKIYELSKLNRNINKTLNDNNIIAGKQKMIELQKEINDLQASGAELSKYDLEYLQAKYELRLAEIELENAQNAKETVRLSKDNEGNWSYVYTASTEKIDEAQQKYEDALYKMQNLSYEYIDEMSEKIISTSQAMMEEIQNLNKNNFENEQEYLAEINRIKAKYAESLGVTEEELNKALANNEELYDKDWQSYSNKTGYAISESQNWIDRYAESTLGTLMKSTSDVADYMNNFSIALDELTNSIYRVAGDYYNGIDDAFAAAGITKEDFASFVTTNTKAIMDASANTKKDVETQTSTLVKEYSIQTDKVTDIQRILDTAIDVYGPYIREIRDILRESAALTKELQNKDATYTYKQAADLFNSKYGEDYKIEMDAEGRWNKTVEGVKNEILQKHAEAKTDEEKKYYADMYTWLTSYILPYVTSLDTGGYTGEWGTSGRLAMLHEKELILNANDTANFLDALNVSRELVNKVIEMNARASSFGIGGLSPSSIQDFAQNLEQQVTITAEFPNAVDHNEIEEAFASLINTASQYANRK